MAGTSTIDILISGQEADERNIFGNNERDQYFTTRMFTTWATYSKAINKNSFLKVTTALSSSNITAKHDYLFLQRDAQGEPLIQNRRFVIDASHNTLQFNPYRRLDLKVDYKMNRKGVTHTIAVVFVNFLGIENQLTLTYAPQPPYIQEQFQLGFLPVFFYRIDF